jgi:murein DD-endopeptidase MepM/ murein hydrolase activator NlpD
MFSFLSEFTRQPSKPLALLVMDEGQMEQPRRYVVDPRGLRLLAVAAALAVLVVAGVLFTLTPLRYILPGTSPADLRADARVQAERVAALQDSLAEQQYYLERMRQLLGASPVAAAGTAAEGEDEAPASGVVPPPPRRAAPPGWSDHQQPAIVLAGLDAAPGARADASRYATSFSLPALPPANGILTRGFEARTGHYAVDIALEEGTVVRSLGEGYVIFADWTHDGGYTLAVQHGDGFVSIYKHNQRLLKRIGERVGAREPIALSGNTGAVTTGPHLHLELWHHGLAQDPRSYVLGW